MKPLVKIPRHLLHRALDDLERIHPFAHERLGFFSFRQSLHEHRPILLCYDYHSIPDDQYVRDPNCGGRIGGAAIQAAMTRAYRDHSGQLWVHTHGRHGHPLPSSTDLAEGPNVIRSVANAQPKAIQGWAIISEEGTWGQVQATDGQLHDFEDMSVIGWPMVIPRRSPHVLPRVGFLRSLVDTLLRRSHPAAPTDRYDRQSFLGPHAQEILQRAKVGIVGLGGGGSHICQQLAHIGFQNLVLCDGDRVEHTNLNRLVGATVQDAWCKRHKTKVSARLFRGLQPTAEIDDAPTHWEAKRSALRECDLIFGCLDSFVVRRDLEAFCRAHMIPFLDIGMIVRRPEGAPAEIHGQVILSMPDGHCMHCLQFLDPENLAEEAQDYNAGAQPQVVWPNGLLASAAVGKAVGLLTGWSAPSVPACRIDLRGSRLTMTDANLLSLLRERPCRHFPLAASGDTIFRSL